MSRCRRIDILLACLVAFAAVTVRAVVAHEGHDHSAMTNGTMTNGTMTNGTMTTAPTTTVASASKPAANGTAGTGAASTASNSSSCFPADASVLTASGTFKRMDELAAGDHVHVGRGHFSEIFMFTHKTAETMEEFVVIDTTSTGARLRLTPGHYLYINDALAAASSVTVGDSIELGDGSLDTVAAVSSGIFRGLYNPQTVQGDIVVDNVRASTYTTAVEPALAHAILAPLRAVYRALGVSIRLFHETSQIGSLFPSGAATY